MDDAPVRVLWAIKGLGPGGAEQLLVQVARASGGRVRYEAAYVVPEKDHLAAPLERAGTRVHPLTTSDDPPGTWVRRLRTLMATGRFDIVHTHSPLVGAAARLVVRTLPRRRRPLLFYTEHNRWSQYRLPTRWLNRLTYRLDGTVLAVSAGVRDSAAPGLRGRVAVVHHGIDRQAVRDHLAERARARADLGVEDGEIVVGTVANLRAEKGYPDLLDAARLVTDTDSGVRFVSVGQGPLEAEIERHRTELGLDDRFVMLGYRPDALAVMAAFDVFVLASHHEGLPVTVMEALTMGIPVVATDVGGLPEAVTDGREGRLVPAGRPELLASAILELTRDRALRHRMGRAAVDASTRFDVARAVSDLEGRYLEALGRPARAG